MKPRTLPLLAALAFTLTTAFADEAPLELRAIVPQGTEGAVEKLLPSRPGGNSQTLWCAKEVLLDASAVQEASAVFDTSTGWAVTVKLTEQGTKQFAEATGRHRHERIGILASGKLLSAPMVNEPIYYGLLNISGNLTEADAKALAAGFMKGKTEAK